MKEDKVLQFFIIDTIACISILLKETCTFFILCEIVRQEKFIHVPHDDCQDRTGSIIKELFRMLRANVFTSIVLRRGYSKCSIRSASAHFSFMNNSFGIHNI